MDQQEKENNESFWNKHSTHVVLGIILIIALIFAITVYNSFNKSISDVTSSIEKWAQVGDFFGGVLNPAFSFLALIALLYTIILQSNELRLTRRELEASKSALQSQSDSLKLQNFETTFFNLITNHKSTVTNFSENESLGVDNEGNHIWNQIRGRNCLYFYYDFFQDAEKYDDSFDIFFSCYRSLINRSGIEFYLNENKSIIDTIVNGSNTIENFNESFYVNILKRFYSQIEIFYLFCFYANENDIEYTNFLKKHTFFENIPLSRFKPRSKKVLYLLGHEVFGKSNQDPYFKGKLIELNFIDDHI